MLKQPDNFVGTIYDYKYAQKVSRMRETFKGGKAVFTQPPAPVKCGGGPQKIVYLCNDYWKKQGIKAAVSFHTAAPAIFGVPYFAIALAAYAKSKGINVITNSQLISVSEKSAKFKNLTTGEIFEESFDLLHAVPQMSAPDFLKGSKISNAAGFVEVGRDMQHKKYKNVWALGDCISLPNAKTAASVFSQAPVLVHNINMHIADDQNRAVYDGYASCPLYLEKGKLMLAEFREYPDENGVLQREIDESFDKGGQTKPRLLFYNIGIGFTYLYSFAIKGKWYGKHSFFKPDYSKGMKDHRWIYKYVFIFPYNLIILGFTLLSSYTLNYYIFRKLGVSNLK